MESKKGNSVFLNPDKNSYYILSTLLILISQIKYDLYEIKMSPQFILLSTFGYLADTDTELFKTIIQFNNEVIKKLNLDKFLLIKNTDCWN